MSVSTALVAEPSAAAPLPCTHAIPGFTYADAPGAIRWLADTLGAQVAHVYPGTDRAVAHAELWFGEACVMLGSTRADDTLPDGTGRQHLYLVLRSRDAVDALHARAAAAGARIVRPPHDTEYGSRDFACADPEGNVWSFGTYAPVRPT